MAGMIYSIERDTVDKDSFASPAIAGLQNIRARIQRMCRDVGRPEKSVELICVSKNFGAEDIVPLLAAGQTIFGENRVQEAKEKWPQLRALYPGISLHLIGPLQSNKASEAVALFDVIETIDRPKIAVAVDAAMQASGKKPRLYIQVNTGEEPQKAGVPPRELGALLSFCREETRLEIDGLMCIPPVDQLASPHFALLNQLAREFQLKELSMGMSDDYELAIQMGATKVRVGSAIFGERRVKISPTTI
jgi:pyridoxal phosphate enzyme (YggS family)